MTVCITVEGISFNSVCTSTLIVNFLITLHQQIILMIKDQFITCRISKLVVLLRLTHKTASLITIDNLNTKLKKSVLAQTLTLENDSLSQDHFLESISSSLDFIAYIYQISWLFFKAQSSVLMLVSELCMQLWEQKRLKSFKRIDVCVLLLL